MIVDIVSERTANLHEELLARLRTPEAVPLNAELYAVAHRPIRHAGQTSLDLWQEPLGLAQALPTLPLWLRARFYLPADLAATYERTCREQRIMNN